jgi:DNA-binding GntR family transcriptional regulator
MSSSLSALDKVRPISIASQVCEQLREKVLTGQLLPGQRLVERQLGEAMGVSQVTVREALHLLEREGLVTKKANTATFVTDLSREKLQEIIEIRLQLEPLAMRLARRGLTPAATRQLQELVDRINGAVKIQNIYSASRADFEFHQIIWEIGRNQTLARMLTQLCTPYFAYVAILAGMRPQNLEEHLHSQKRLLEYFRSDFEDRYKSHQFLLDVLKDGKVREAERAIQEHVRESWAFLLPEG